MRRTAVTWQQASHNMGGCRTPPASTPQARLGWESLTTGRCYVVIWTSNALLADWVGTSLCRSWERCVALTEAALAPFPQRRHQRIREGCHHATHRRSNARRYDVRSGDRRPNRNCVCRCRLHPRNTNSFVAGAAGMFAHVCTGPFWLT